MQNTEKVAAALEQFSKRKLGAVKVLMIEDDPIITTLVTSLLSRAGCVPYSTLSSTEAISLAEQFSPHVIILDLMMPVLSGEDFLVQLKAREDLKDIPVVVFTNKGDAADKEAVMRLGAAAYLVKASTDLPKLVEVVKELALKE